MIPFTRLRGVTAAWSIDSFPSSISKTAIALCDGWRQSCHPCSDEALKIGGTFVPELAPYQTVSLDPKADPNLDVLFMEELGYTDRGKDEEFLHTTIDKLVRQEGGGFVGSNRAKGSVRSSHFDSSFRVANIRIEVFTALLRFCLKAYIDISLARNLHLAGIVHAPTGSA